jgi:signal transduction histidine kinase
VDDNNKLAPQVVGGTEELRSRGVIARELIGLRRDYESLKEQNQALSHQVVALQIIEQLTQTLTLDLALDDLLKKILHSAVQVVRASAGSLLLLDQETDELVFAVIEGGGGASLVGQRLAKGVGIAGWVAEHKDPIIVDDVNKDERYFSSIAEDTRFETTSLLCAPMIAKGELVGVLQILNKKSGQPFSDDDLEILTTFAAQSAIAIENSRLYHDVREERDRIVAVEEEVRRRLARDLHDGLAQLLAAMVMNIKFVQDLLKNSPEQAAKELAQLEPLVSKALRQVRTLLFDLRPVILETHGLVPALESYVERLGQDSPIDYRLLVRAEIPRLNSRAEAAVFAIVQEAINNAKKHAYAQHMAIVVDRQDDDLTVTIRDDGTGFDLKEVDAEYGQRGSLGLLNMRERADMLSGELSIETDPGQGTAVRLHLSVTSNLRPNRENEEE